jgi:hypothetical protein
MNTNAQYKILLIYEVLKIRKTWFVNWSIHKGLPIPYFIVPNTIAKLTRQGLSSLSINMRSPKEGWFSLFDRLIHLAGERHSG